MSEKTKLPLMITTTFEERQQAEEMAALLLRERLIACAQINGPIISAYWWKEEIVTSQEFSLSVKTLAKNYTRVEHVIKTYHPYDVPEIIGTSIVQISDDYRNWLIEELKN